MDRNRACRGDGMNLTRFIPFASRPALNNTTKAAVSRRPAIPSRTIMGSLNGHTNGAPTKQNGAPTPLIPIASRLEEGRALAEDVWSIFKYVLTSLHVHFASHVLP